MLFDHQVVAGKVEAFDERGKEGQEVPVAPPEGGHLLQHAGDDPVPFDPGVQTAGLVDEGEDVGPWIELTQGIEHLLAAPHAGQPVVNEGNPHQRSATSR